MEYVVDTNIVVHYARRSPAAEQIEADYRLLEGDFRPLVSAVTVGEARAFALASRWGAWKVEKLVSFLRDCVVVEVGRPEVIEAYADLYLRNRKSGANVGQNDLWIAATANALDVPLLTTDRDFDRLHSGTVRLVRLDAQTGATLS